jgi:hypothetical protein
VSTDDAPPTIVVKPWETRTLEGALVLIGALVLALGGFVAAFPFHLGTGSSSQTTSTGPVTLARATTLGTTPTVVTVAHLEETSSSTSTRDASEALLGTIFGIGALLVLGGALYRRLGSLSGFGISLSLQGVVDDPAVQTAVAKEVSALAPDATPEVAALLSAKALSNLAKQPRQVITVGPVSNKTGWTRLRSDRLASPEPMAEGAQEVSSLNLGGPSDADITKAVADAASEVLR